MKHTSILILCYLLCVVKMQGQTHTESIADVVIAGQRATISTLLGIELGLRNTQTGLIRALKREEDTYADKRGPLANISNSLVLITAQSMISSLTLKIKNIERNIRIRKYATFGIRHGLSRHESELKKEKKYFEKLANEYQTLYSGLLISGGAGYNYSAFLKLLKRIMILRNRIVTIDKDVKALMSASRILAR